MPTDITVIEDTTKRYRIDLLDEGGSPYDLTGATLRLIVKAKTSDATPVLDFTLAVDGAGNPTSTPAGRLALGRPNPVDIGGPLLDATPASGYVTLEIYPADTADMVTTATKSFLWEAKLTVGTRKFFVGNGAFSVVDSIFDN